MGDVNRVGKMRPLERRFVPANLLNTIALNRVIKNNFFNGSYVLELFDITKAYVEPLFETPEALALLSEEIGKVLPIDLASVSDRLGNIVVQFPIEVMRADFHTSGTDYTVEVAWHPESKARKLIAICSAYDDQTPVSFGCVELFEGIREVCAHTDPGVLRGYIWDVNNALLLAATDDCRFLTRISINTSLAVPEPRVFPISLADNAPQERVQLRHSPELSGIGDFEAESIITPIQKRIYDEERRKLAQQRTFVQYGAGGKVDGKKERKRALDDIRILIDKYGTAGVWLWDPYLSPQDILDTLFWNKTRGSLMRALTLCKTAGKKTAAKKIRDTYARQLSALNSNFQGLRIEFRSAHGPSGWNFHDRFLIFPASSKTSAKAWSLGASVNSVGKKHHILQQVDNAQLIVSAFEELWTAVSEAENLIWQCP